MERMQIYLSEAQRQILNIYSEQEHQSVSELIRQAIDTVYLHKPSMKEVDRVLKETSGLWGDRTDIKSGVDYVRELRSGWRKPE